jgi:hypothetical protein
MRNLKFVQDTLIDGFLQITHDAAMGAHVAWRPRRACSLTSRLARPLQHHCNFCKESTAAKQS